MPRSSTFGAVLVLGCLMSSVSCRGGVPSAAGSAAAGAAVTAPATGGPLHLRGVCYGPFRDGESPESGVFPTREEMVEDLVLISGFADAIRTYGATGTPSEIPGICGEVGLECYPGAWLSTRTRDNEAEIAALSELAGRRIPAVKGLIVGNEVLLREDMPIEELVACIQRVSEVTEIPVTTAETPDAWLENPQLVDAVDFILVHLHPYWGGTAIEDAVALVLQQYAQLRDRYPSKRVVIGETGWPSDGETVGEARPSAENLRAFAGEFVRRANDADIEYFLFEVFDEAWKTSAEGVVGAHWGLYRSNGRLKEVLSDLLPAGIDRPARVLRPVSVSAPLAVWREPGNAAFLPSGWMGTISTISMDDAAAGAHSGDACVKLTFLPVGDVWAGIYWQYPVNNWGDYPGYALTGASRLVFWARGEHGGEQAEFKVGGVSDPGKPYRDSFGPLSSGVLTLGAKWTRYKIPLAGRDLTSLLGGFCWVTNTPQNPNGATIFVDDIVIE